MHLTNVKFQKRIEDHLSGRIARPDFIFYVNALIQFTLTNMFSGMTSGDKAFFGFTTAMVVAFLGKLWFDNAGRAMEKGYDATFVSAKFGNMGFTKANESSNETKEPQYSECSEPEDESPEEADKD